MRLWHYELLPYLPDAQFKGQLRELVAIMHDWRDKGKTNHLLINRVMEYPKEELSYYFLFYKKEYERRYKKEISNKYLVEFQKFAPVAFSFVYEDEVELFKGWHNKEYLRICMANLMEKYAYGVGTSRIGVNDWLRLCDSYKAITGEDYEI
jgi:uncharacterized protein (TIGR02328 family)